MDLKSVGDFLSQNQGSISILLFVILFVYHKSQVIFTTKLIDSQKEIFEKIIQQQKESFEKIIEQQNKREEQNFGLLKDMLESIHYQSTVISKLEAAVQANQFCPFMRKNKQLKTDNEG